VSSQQNFPTHRKLQIIVTPQAKKSRPDCGRGKKKAVIHGLAPKIYLCLAEPQNVIWNLQMHWCIHYFLLYRLSKNYTHVSHDFSFRKRVTLTATDPMRLE
jgi:hypothetical protein